MCQFVLYFFEVLSPPTNQWRESSRRTNMGTAQNQATVRILTTDDTMFGLCNIYLLPP